jgi:MtrB/PioB family decaheme-associated outer membrane protein
MKMNLVKSLCATMFASILITSASVVFAGDLEVDGSVTVGAQHLELNGEEASKYEEYRDLDEDLVLQQIRLRGKKDDYYFTVDGANLIRDDRSLRAEGGRYGRFKVRVGWDEIPHNFTPDERFLGVSGGEGVWAVPDISQLTLEPDFPLGGDPPNSPTATGVTNLLDLLSHAPEIDLGVEREIGSVALAYIPFRRFNVRAGYKHESREGFRALSAGAYRRDSDGAVLVGGVGENFTLYGLELPEPIDYDTDEVSLGFDYRQGHWHTDFSYRFTSFSNETSDVTWDNPLRLNGVDSIQGGAALNRLDLFPDSRSHMLSLTGGIANLPCNSKLTGTLAWGRVIQDDDFLRYTVNRALTKDNDGVTIGADLPLPAGDLDGEVTTTLLNAVLSSRPIKPLSLTLSGNYYDYENDSDEISWVDGWARIGESVWSKAAEAGVINRVPEWERIRGKLGATYKVNKILMLMADYTIEKYNRNRDRNADTKENIFGVGVRLSPLHWAMLRLSYHQGDRDIDGTYQPAPADPFFEWDQLRMFDQADRERDTFDAYLSLDPTDQLSLGFALTYNDDEYDTAFYGLQENDGYVAGIDVSYVISDRATVFGYYSRDDYDTEMKLRSKSDSAGGGSFAVPENDFVTDIDDITDTVGGGVLVSLIPDKLTFQLSVDYSFAQAEIGTSNPNFVAGTTTSSATGFDWPDVETETTEVKAELKYNWTEQLSTSLHYLYRTFDLDDFATDDVLLYGNPNDTQGNSLDYFIYMDANYRDYNAHLFKLTLSYAF